MFKTLLTLLFTTAFTATTYAASYGVVEFGSDVYELQKLQPKAIFIGSNVMRADYNVFLIVDKSKIFDIECSSSQYIFRAGSNLYSVEYDVSDSSYETMKNIKNLFDKKFGNSLLIEQNANYESLMWSKNDIDIILNHKNNHNYSYTKIIVTNNTYKALAI